MDTSIVLAQQVHRCRLVLKEASKKKTPKERGRYLLNELTEQWDLIPLVFSGTTMKERLRRLGTPTALKLANEDHLKKWTPSFAMKLKERVLERTKRERPPHFELSMGADQNHILFTCTPGEVWCDETKAKVASVVFYHVAELPALLKLLKQAGMDVVIR